MDFLYIHVIHEDYLFLECPSPEGNLVADMVRGGGGLENLSILPGHPLPAARNLSILSPPPLTLSATLAATNVGALCHRNRTFKDASGTSLGHCVSPRGDAVEGGCSFLSGMIPGGAAWER